MLNEAGTVVAQVGAAIVALGGVIYTQRQSARAAKISQVQSAKNDMIEGYDKLVKSQSDRLEQAWDRLTELEAEQASCRAKITELEDRVNLYGHRYRAAMQYIIQLRRWINDHFPDATPPVPPPDLEDPLDI